MSESSKIIKKAVYTSDCYKFNGVKWDREPKFIVDIGANVGWFTKLVAEKKPNCKVLSYELMSENYNEALKNLEGLQNVFLFNKAVIGDNKATAYVRAPNNIGGHRALYDKEDTYISEKRYRDLIFDKDAKDGATIHEDLPQQISLKQIIEENEIDFIDFLKLDCEGCEHELMLHIFKHNLEKKILNMALEFHGRTWPEWEQILEELESRFDVIEKTSKSILTCKNNH